MSKEILFTNGAIQNRDFSLDEKPYKAVGIISARVLNHLVGSEDIIHNWNNVGMFADTDEFSTKEERTRKKYIGSFMQAHLERWGDQDRVTVASDDDAYFSYWTQDIVAQAISSGNIYQENAEFVACRKCGTVIAVSVTKVTVCSRCGATDALYTKEETGLFADLPSNSESLFRYEQLFNKNNIKQELDAFKQLPARLLLSRHRDNGISLESIDMPDKVLDPRLGIGLLAVFHASRLGYAKAGIVQSYSTLIRTAPYLNGIIKDSDTFGVAEHVFALHSKIEPSLLTYPEITPELLCFHAMRQKADITLDKLPAILKEKDGLIRKAAVIKNLCTDSTVLLEIAKSPFNQYDDELAAGNLVDVLAKVNKNLGRSIAFVKHGNLPDGDEEKVVVDTYSSVKSLQPII